MSFGGTLLTPAAIAAASITVAIPAGDVANARVVAVTVVSTDGVPSNAANFTVNATPTVIGARADELDRRPSNLHP